MIYSQNSPMKTSQNFILDCLFYICACIWNLNEFLSYHNDQPPKSQDSVEENKEVIQLKGFFLHIKK